MQCCKANLSFYFFMSVRVNTTLLVYCPSSLLNGVWPLGPRCACLHSVSSISPTATRTVSSTIKGCAIMKGALAEALYFLAQCWKGSPLLIFQRLLCVPYSGSIGEVTGMDEEDALGLNE